MTTSTDMSIHLTHAQALSISENREAQPITINSWIATEHGKYEVNAEVNGSIYCTCI